MKSTKPIVFILIILIGGFVTASALTIYPTDDMYIDTIFTTQHDSTHLYVAGDPIEPHINEIMMKFDLGPFMGEQIDAAVLYLYRFYGCGEGNTVANFYEITEEWDEASWPDDQYIEHGDFSWARFTFTQIGYNAIEITGMIQAFMDEYMTNYGFAIVGEDGTRLSKLYSSESPIEVAPYLELIGLTGIDDDQPMPRDFDVRAYPNPFNARATISYTLAEPSMVTIEIYDILGNLVETLVNQNLPVGHHQIGWNAGYMSSGMYFYRIQAGDQSKVDKLILLK
jgi:hypothetical protein